MNKYTLDVVDEGVACLCEHLGIMKMELFISAIQTERFDYTKWHQHFVDTISEEDFDALCIKSAGDSPLTGDSGVILE